MTIGAFCDDGLQKTSASTARLAMTIGAFCDDGLQVALEIQQAYGQEVFAFSEESSPNVIALLPIRSIQELAKLLKLR